MVLSFQTLQHKGIIPWWLSCNLITFHQPPSRSKEDSSKTVIIPPDCWYNLVGRFNYYASVNQDVNSTVQKSWGFKEKIYLILPHHLCLPKAARPQPSARCEVSSLTSTPKYPKLHVILESWNGSPPNLRFWSFPVFSSFQGPSCLNSPAARAVPGCTFSNGTLEEWKGPLWKPMIKISKGNSTNWRVARINTLTPFDMRITKCGSKQFRLCLK